MAKKKRGGSRLRSGNKLGKRHKTTLHREKALADAHRKIEAILGPKAFTGNAVAFMAFVYKNDGYPLEIRLDAAKGAAPYETPKLAQKHLHGGDGDAPPIRIEALNAKQLELLLARVEAALTDDQGSDKG
jgi:hypothetical protein